MKTAILGVKNDQQASLLSWQRDFFGKFLCSIKLHAQIQEIIQQQFVIICSISAVIYKFLFHLHVHPSTYTLYTSLLLWREEANNVLFLLEICPGSQPLSANL